jgi:hypothetical protein
VRGIKSRDYVPRKFRVLAVFSAGTKVVIAENLENTVW